MVTVPPLVFVIILEVDNSRTGNFKVETGKYGVLAVSSSDLLVAYGRS